MKIALVGDYAPTVIAHQAVPQALEITADALSTNVDPVWIRSSEIDPQSLRDFDALWCVPFSPYENPLAVIAAIKFARENDRPFLGTCAGYQHAVLEYARNVLGIVTAESSEDNPNAAVPLITALACRLDGEADAINIDPGSQVDQIYQAERVHEEYNCGFGVNPGLQQLFDDSELNFCGRDDNGDPRVFELTGNRFFIGTAYQPERSAFKRVTHPLILAFLEAAL